MLDRMLDAIATTVTRRRAAVLFAVLAFVLFCASWLPALETETSPENLIISYGGYEERVRDLHRWFGDHDSVVALLVEAQDVTDLEALRYVHRLSRHFQADSNVVRVESLTVTPLPGARVQDAALTLEALDAEPAPIEPRYEEALQTLIATEPERFPMGAYSVAERLGDGSADVRGVVRGQDVTAAEAEAIRRALEDAPLVVGRLVSADRRIAAVVLFLDPALGTGPRRLEAVHAIDAWLAASPPPPGVRVHAAGLPHLRAAISDAMVRDQTFLVPLSILVCTLLLFASFRWAPATLLPLATVGIGVVCVLGLMAFAGERMTVLMSTLPTLLIIMGISEAVHVVGRYMEEARRSTDRVAAAQRTIRQLAIACFLASFTTAIGFASLVVARTEMLRRFGVVAALGVMLTYVVLVTFVPAAISYFAPPRTHAARSSQARARGRLQALLVLGTAWVARRRSGVLGAALLLVGPCVWAYRTIRVDTSLLDTFDADDPIVASTRLVERHLDGIRPLEILVESARDVRDPEVLAAVDRIAAWAATQPGVLRTTTPGDVLWETWRRIAGIGSNEARTPFRSRAQVDALMTLLERLEPSPMRAYVTDDGRRARAEIRLADIGAQRSIALIRAIEARAEAELGPVGARATLLGEAYIGSHGVDAVVQDMFGSLSLSALVIFLTIGLLFRSARLGFLAIPPNAMPQLGAVAWMALRGIPLDASTAIVFSVAIGVSVDLTIHGFARLVEEEQRGLRRRAAIVRAARSTGRAIVVSCATLVLGFSVLLASGFVPVRHFGELLAVALSLSLASTLVLQPALLMVAGPTRKAAASPRTAAASPAS